MTFSFQVVKLDPWDNFCFHVYAQKCQVVRLSKFDPWDMLNNFCFHVYAQKSLFIGENGKDFILTSSSLPPYPLTLEFIELVHTSQLKTY